MQTPKPVVAITGAMVSAVCLVPTPSLADDAGWRDGWCREGEGISVVVDWHLAPPALATPLVTDGDQTHLVRCVGLGEAPVPPDARALLALTGIEHNPHGLIASVNGIALDGFEFSWHLRAGTEGRWTDADWLLDPTAHVAMSYTVRDMDPSIVDAPQPVLSPVYAPPLPTDSPSPTASPTPTGDPVDDPGGEPSGEPSGTPTPAPSAVEPGDPSAEPEPSPPVVPSAAPPPTPPTPSVSAPPSPSPTPTRSTIPSRRITPTTPRATTSPPPAATPTPTPAAPSSPAPVLTSSTPDAPEVVRGEESVERGPAATDAAAASRWSGGLIGGLFVAIASGGAVLARRWTRHELDAASRMDDE